MKESKIILQFGEGNFLRCFVDWMLQRASDQSVFDAEVTVVSPRFSNNATMQGLKASGGRYHALLQGMTLDGQPRKTVYPINVIRKALSPREEMKEYQAVVEDPELRFIVSNTTEAGIAYAPDDISSLISPQTFPGKITALLYHRFIHFGGDGAKGLIFLPCELIEHNGQTLRRIVLRHAREHSLGHDFEAWVEQNCYFADTLVDRIVSGHLDDSAQDIGADDPLSAVGEEYNYWAIGGAVHRLIQNELPLDAVEGINVEFMEDIAPCRERKVRILNGLHTPMAAVGLLCGCSTVEEAVNNAKIKDFLQHMLKNEILPVIPGEEEELKNYAQGIFQRFYNPYIHHRLESISLNAMSKWLTRCLPTVRDYYKHFSSLPRHEMIGLAALLRQQFPDLTTLPGDLAMATAEIPGFLEQAKGLAASPVPIIELLP